MSSILTSAPIELSAATSAHAIALAYVSDSEGVFSFKAPANLIQDIEKYFAINLEGELSFFSPTGKVGEIFEIPVSEANSRTERIFLTSAGDGSKDSLRTCATAIARKVRGKKITVYSACALNKVDIQAHAISLTMAAYVWSLKSGKPADVPTFLVATDEKETINAANAFAKAYEPDREQA